MKKTAIFFIVLAILCLLFNNKVHAQAFDAAKAYSDYQYQLSIYQQSSSDYQDSKTFYLKNPTLQLKEDARQKTLKMLRDRDQLIVVYLTALRMQIYETTGFNDDQKNAIFQKLDTEVEWYKNHSTSYLTDDSLELLFTKSDESKNRYNNTTLVINEARLDISLSQEIGLRVAHQAVYSDLKNYINDQVSKGLLRIDPFNRWINDTDAVLALLQTNETTANTKIQAIYSQNYGLNQTYDSSVKILDASLSPLSQLNNYLTEMLASIQNQSQ